MTDDEQKALAEIETMLRRRQPALTYREIAAALGISHGTVQNIERRALDKLRRRASKGAT